MLNCSLLAYGFKNSLITRCIFFRIYFEGKMKIPNFERFGFLEDCQGIILFLIKCKFEFK